MYFKSKSLRNIYALEKIYLTKQKVALKFLGIRILVHKKTSRSSSCILTLIKNIMSYGKKARQTKLNKDLTSTKLN